MIYFSSPYLTGNLGKAYNEFCMNVPSDAWVCFTDADSMFLNAKYGSQLQTYIELFGDEIDLFTAYCNRVGEKKQVLNGRISNDSNIINHYKITEELAQKPPSIKMINSPISGFLMMFNIKKWMELGGFDSGILGVDNFFSKKVLDSGGKIAVMETVYLFHYYRLHKNIGDKSHLL